RLRSYKSQHLVVRSRCERRGDLLIAISLAPWYARHNADDLAIDFAPGGIITFHHHRRVLRIGEGLLVRDARHQDKWRPPYGLTACHFQVDAPLLLGFVVKPLFQTGLSRRRYASAVRSGSRPLLL